eukprot:3941924-Rhodomonas_salina.1
MVVVRDAQYYCPSVCFYANCGSVRYGSIVWCCAMRGTELAYGAVRVCRTELAYAAPRKSRASTAHGARYQ